METFVNKITKYVNLLKIMTYYSIYKIHIIRALKVGKTSK